MASGGTQIFRDGPWYAVQVRSRHEKAVARQLDAHRIANFLPLYSDRRQWSDRRQHVELPVFPGYLFAHLDSVGRANVLKMGSVVRVLGATPTDHTPVDPLELENLNAAILSGLPLVPCPFVETGDRVRVEEGPLRSVEGTVMELKGTCKLMISISLLRRAVSVEIDRAWVRRIGSGTTRPKLS